MCRVQEIISLTACRIYGGYKGSYANQPSKQIVPHPVTRAKVASMLGIQAGIFRVQRSVSKTPYIPRPHLPLGIHSQLEQCAGADALSLALRPALQPATQNTANIGKILGWK